MLWASWLSNFHIQTRVFSPKESPTKSGGKLYLTIFNLSLALGIAKITCSTQPLHIRQLLGACGLSSRSYSFSNISLCPKYDRAVVHHPLASTVPLIKGQVIKYIKDFFQFLLAKVTRPRIKCHQRIGPHMHIALPSDLSFCCHIWLGLCGRKYC